MNHCRYLSAAVEEYTLDVLRMDYNLDPGMRDTSYLSCTFYNYLSSYCLEHFVGPIWQANDKDGRSGLVEVAYVEGLYTMWDAILSMHPGLLIDDCSSGGRRIDVSGPVSSLHCTCRSLPCAIIGLSTPCRSRHLPGRFHSGGPIMVGRLQRLGLSHCKFVSLQTLALSAYTVAQLAAPADSCYRGSQKAWG